MRPVSIGLEECRLYQPVEWDDIMISGTLIGCEIRLQAVNGPEERGIVTWIDGQTGSLVLTYQRNARRLGRRVPWVSVVMEAITVLIQGQQLHRTWDGRYCCAIDRRTEAIMIPHAWQARALRTVLRPQ